MRSLNRPMFKNGGPIKEGIMSGMKEPQAINTVGSPLAPQDSSGRQGYALPLLYYGGMGLAAAGRMLAPRAIAAAGKAFGRGVMTSPGAGTGVFGKGLTMGQRLKNLLPSQRFRNAGSKINLGGKNPNNLPVPYGATMDATGKLGLRQSLTDPRRLGMAIRENPLTAFTAAGQIKNTPEILGGAFDIGKKAVQGGTNYLLGTEFGKNKGLEETGDGTKLERVDSIKTVPNGDTGGSTTSDAEKDKINEDRINETKQKYYKLMGIDKMNKNAAYDSLIDASKIIQEEGGDLKGSVKSGTLQNRIIQAISGNLDKSADLKKQIDAAVLKGEISKDIEKSKMDSFDKQLKVLGVDGYRKKSLGLTSVAEDINLQNMSGKSIPTSNSVASSIVAKGTGVNGILPDDKYQKWEKGNEGKDEIDFISENFSGLDDGLYVVNKKAVKVQDGQISFIDLDSIIG